MLREAEKIIAYDKNGWASDKDFKNGLTKQLLYENVSSSGIPLMVDNSYVYVDAEDLHTLIFGNTGSKKTRNFCIPNVYTLGMAGESMIISDPKSEIYTYTSGFLASERYDIKVINFRDMGYGSHWNPLALPYFFYKNGQIDRGTEMVRDFCNMLLQSVHSEKDIFWENVAKNLLEGLILLLFECAENEEEVNMRSVHRLRSYMRYFDSENKSSKVFFDFIDTLSKDSLIIYKLMPVLEVREQKLEKTYGSIMITFDTMIAPFISQENLMELTGSNDIDFERIATQKTVLFLIVPDEKKTMHFMVSVFVKQCYEYLIYFAQKQQNRTLPLRMNFILDEFSNFTRIEDMPSMISAARSRNIRFTLVVQSKRQLDSLYDKDADTIRSNCRNWIFLASREIELLNEMERLCGTLYTATGLEYPIMNISDLQNLKIGWEESEALVLRPQLLPYISKVKDFTAYPQSKYEEVSMVKRKIEKTKIFSLSEYLSRKEATKADDFDKLIHDLLFSEDE